MNLVTSNLTTNMTTMNLVTSSLTTLNLVTTNLTTMNLVASNLVTSFAAWHLDYLASNCLSLVEPWERSGGLVGTCPSFRPEWAGSDLGRDTAQYGSEEGIEALAGGADLPAGPPGVGGLALLGLGDVPPRLVVRVGWANLQPVPAGPNQQRRARWWRQGGGERCTAAVQRCTITCRSARVPAPRRGGLGQGDGERGRWCGW